MDVREFRESGHQLIDLLSEYLEHVAEKPLFPDVDPKKLAASFDEPLPRDGAPLGEVIDAVKEKVLPYCVEVNHPGYFGFITPPPTPAGILGDLIASALNQNIGAYSIGPSAVTLEQRTVRWLNDLVGYGPEAGGNLTSGGTMANFTGLKLARDWASGDRAQHEGVKGTWVAYTSEERHVSVDKAADCVGIGRDNLRILPTDDRFRLRLDALENAIAEDRREGRYPMAIVAMGGSTNTGAVDALPELRRIADREKLWLHVDAAYGGGMLISQEYLGVLTGLELADSVTLDPHKWFFAPLDAGAVLVKDAASFTRSFGMRPPYLRDDLDPHGERFDYYVHGFEQSRRFRSLKVWMSFKRYGTKAIGEWIDANVAQAHRLYALASVHPEFEPATEPVMSAICIRYRFPVRDERESLQRHAEVAARIAAQGRFWFTTTMLKERAYFRINPVNFRTQIADMDALFETLCRECAATAG